MVQDSWAEAYEPLEMLDRLREPSKYYSRVHNRLHPARLLTYTQRCLYGVSAIEEAALFERIASGTLGVDELATGREALTIRAGRRNGGGYSQGRKPRRVPLNAQRARAALAAIDGFVFGLWGAATGVTRETQHLLQRDQCAWLRCLFPDPMKPSVIERAWLTSTVLELAHGIAADSAFDRLPILADALQDAGCASEGLLHHCRRDTIHAAHCWIMPALLEVTED